MSPATKFTKYPPNVVADIEYRLIRELKLIRNLLMKSPLLPKSTHVTIECMSDQDSHHYIRLAKCRWFKFTRVIAILYPATAGGYADNVYDVMVNMEFVNNEEDALIKLVKEVIKSIPNQNIAFGQIYWRDVLRPHVNHVVEVNWSYRTRHSIHFIPRQN